MRQSLGLIRSYLDKLARFMSVFDGTRNFIAWQTKNKRIKMRNLVVLTLIVLFFTGCGSKNQGEPAVIYKELMVPVRCNATMPSKPEYDESFESAKAKRIYWDEIENLLRQCIGESDAN